MRITDPRRLLTTQTSYRCEHRHCGRASSGNNRLTISGRAYMDAHVCTLHAFDANDCAQAAKITSNDGSRWHAVFVPYGPRCFCGAPLLPNGVCEAFHHAFTATRRGFSCDCTVCVVGGGDCARAAAYDGCWMTIGEHNAFAELFRFSTLIHEPDFDPDEVPAYLVLVLGREHTDYIAQVEAEVTADV